jgi:hypothetical protein
VNERRGRARVPQPAWRPGPAGVREHGERPPGFPSNRRDLSSSLVRCSAAEVPNPKPPGPPGQRLGPVGAKGQAQRGYRRAAQESGETGRQGSEPSIVPWRPGDSSREDPAKGREGRVTDPRSGNKARTPSLGTLSMRRPRIAQRGGEAVT